MTVSETPSPKDSDYHAVSPELPSMYHSDLQSDSDVSLLTDPSDLSVNELIPSGDHELLPVDLPENESPRYLYSGCQVTAESAHVLISSFSYRHQLSGQAQTDLLYMLQFLLPKPNNLPGSLFLFRKGERESGGDILRHYFCLRCFTVVGEPKATSVSQ